MEEIRPGFYGKDLGSAKQPVGVVAAVVPWNMPQFLTIAKVIPHCSPAAPWWSSQPRSPHWTHCCSPNSSRRPSCRPGCSTWSPATATSASTWSPIPASTRSRSPGRRRPVARWRWPAPPGSSRSASNSAASRRPSCSTTPTRRPRPRHPMASLANSGQVCNALSRVLVPAARKDEFVDALAAELAALTVGDPADPPPSSVRWWPSVSRSGSALHRIGRRRGPAGASAAARCPTGWTPAGTSSRRCSPTPTTHADRARGDLRPGADRHPLRRRGRGVAIANDSDSGWPAVFTADADRGSASRRGCGRVFGVNEGYIMDPRRRSAASRTAATAASSDARVSTATW